MSAFPLISGRLWRDPQRKVSQAGKPYATASVRVGDGDGAQWWHVAAFAEDVIEVLIQLANGDALAASGPMTATIFDSASGPRVNLSLVAHRLISARPMKRERDKPPPQRKAFGAPQPYDDQPFDEKEPAS